MKKLQVKGRISLLTKKILNGLKSFFWKTDLMIRLSLAQEKGLRRNIAT